MLNQSIYINKETSGDQYTLLQRYLEVRDLTGSKSDQNTIGYPIPLLYVMLSNAKHPYRQDSSSTSNEHSLTLSIRHPSRGISPKHLHQLANRKATIPSLRQTKHKRIYDRKMAYQTSSSPVESRKVFPLAYRFTCLCIFFNYYNGLLDCTRFRSNPVRITPRKTNCRVGREGDCCKKDHPIFKVRLDGLSSCILCRAYTGVSSLLH